MTLTGTAMTAIEKQQVQQARQKSEALLNAPMNEAEGASES